MPGSQTVPIMLKVKSREVVTERKHKMKKYLSVPKEASADSKGFAKGSPGRPLGIRPPIKTLYSQFPALK